MDKRKWLRGILIAGVLLCAASFGFSRTLRAGAVRRYLIAHLAASFGRPVEVSWFDFSLLDGARIEAHLVSVADDPRFGNEYFLRSESVTAGLRWSSLFAGRFEFGAVSLARPSLNLVRADDGSWNIEHWLPPATASSSRPGFVGPVPPQRDARAARPARIEVTGGRINFKQGATKNAFALTDVSGRVEQTAAGRWQLDLSARPMRAGTELQDIGTVSVRGSIAGTTARLQPAELNFTWRDASIADALRLARNQDYGMRGTLAVDLDARIAPEASAAGAPDAAPAAAQGAQWTVSGVARLTGVHGWRLPARATDPSANLSVDASWRLGDSRAAIRTLTVEMSASHLAAQGEVDWAHGPRPELEIDASTLAFGDALAWYKALKPDVAEDLRADGALGLNLKLAGWPLQLQDGVISSTGGTVSAKALPAPLRIGAVSARVSKGEIDLAPAQFSFAAAPVAANEAAAAENSSAQPNSFVARGSLFPDSTGVFRWPPDWNLAVEGATPHAQDWLALSAALAQPARWSGKVAGGLAMKLRGARRANGGQSPWIGSMDFAALTVNPGYVNQPVNLARAHVEFTPQQRTVSISSADAFGSMWRGSISRKYPDTQWTFDLTADRLDVNELDRWLGPRARAGFLARLTGAASSSASASPPAVDATITQLEARGRLRAGAIDVPPMRLEQFDSQAELSGRTLRIERAQATMYGGSVAGSFEAHLDPDPSYSFQGRLERVDLEQLGNAVPFLADRIGGTARGTIELSAHGVGRDALISSLQGQGTLAGKNASLLGMGLTSVFSGDAPEATPDTFASVQGSYRIESKSIELSNFIFENSRGKLDVEGRVDFSHALNLRVQPSIYQAAAAPAAASPPAFVLGGTFEAPKLTPMPATLKAQPRNNGR